MAHAALRPTGIHGGFPPAYPSAPVSARLPRWSLVLIGLTALLAAAVLALVIFMLKRDPRTAVASPAPSPQSERANEARAVQPAASARPRAISPPQPLEADVPLMKRNDAPATTKSPFQDPLLEVVGSLTAAHLYQTYLNINLLADGTEAELYSRADANKMLEEVSDLLNTVERQLARVPEKNLKDEDRKSLAQVRLLMNLLRTQAKELQAYWTNGDKEHADRFHKAREAAGAGIRDLLDLPD